MKYLLPSAFFLLVLSTQIVAQNNPEPKETKKGPPFAFVLLEKDKLPDEVSLKKALTKVFGKKDAAKIKDIEIDPKKKNISFELEGKACMAAVMPRPVPEADINYAVYNSFLWPKAKEVTAKHKFHLIVFALGDFEKPWHRALRLSKVIATCIESFEGVNAVYWGSANIVHEPSAFVDILAESGQTVENLPVSLWVGFLRDYHKDKTVSLYTDGLDVLGAKEFEIVKSKKKMSDLYEFLFNVSLYAAFHGDVVKDGDTLGGSAEERITSKWTDSAIDREGKVVRIDY